MILLALLLGLLASPSFATTYYVDAATGSSSNNGSIGSPWDHPQRCVTKSPALQPGDICLVKNGTYDPLTSTSSHTVSISGATAPQGVSGNPVIFRAENYLGAVIRLPTKPSDIHNGFLVSRQYIQIEGFDITGQNLTPGQYDTTVSFTGISLQGQNNIITRNRIHDIGRVVCSESANGFQGIFVYGGANALIERNRIDTVGRRFNGELGCSTARFQNDHGIYLDVGNGTTIRRNLFYDNSRGYSVHIYNAQAVSYQFQNITLDHNTFDTPAGETRGPGCHILYSKTMVNFTVRNNIFSRPETSAITSHTPTQAVTNAVFKGNRTDKADANFHCSTLPSGMVVDGTNVSSASLGFTNLGAGDYTLASGSASIDTGYNYGAAFNGSAPDPGAFESIPVATCEVQASATSTVRVTFANNVFPPLLPASGAITFTARKNSASNAVSGSVTRVGDGIFDIPVTNSYAGGDTVDISWASGNVTDSALIGGSLNQPIRTLTNQSCTNNASGAPSHVFTQATYRFYGIYGPETTTDIRSAEGASSYSVVKGGAARIRFALTCSVADCPPTAFYLYGSVNTVDYAQLTETFSGNHIALCADRYPSLGISNGELTTDRLSTGGTFVPGAFILHSNAIPTIGLSSGQKTELEYCVAWDASASGTHNLRLQEQSGAVLGTYTVTPSIVLIDPQANAGP